MCNAMRRLRVLDDYMISHLILNNIFFFFKNKYILASCLLFLRNYYIIWSKKKKKLLYNYHIILYFPIIHILQCFKNWYKPEIENRLIC